MEASSVIPAAEHCIYTSCYCEENVWKLCELVRRTCTDDEMNKCYTVFYLQSETKGLGPMTLRLVDKSRSFRLCEDVLSSDESTIYSNNSDGSNKMLDQSLSRLFYTAGIVPSVIPLWHQRARKAENMPVVWDYHVVFIYKHKDGSLVYDLDTLLPFPCSFHQYLAACIGENSLLKPEFWRMFRIVPAAQFLAHFASDRTHMLKEDGAWLAPPPDYPPIHTEECSSNLQECISMDPSEGFGHVLHLVEFIALFDSKG